MNDLTRYDLARKGMPQHVAQLIWSLDLIGDKKLRRHLIGRIEEYAHGTASDSGEEIRGGK